MYPLRFGLDSSFLTLFHFDLINILSLSTASLSFLHENSTTSSKTNFPDKQHLKHLLRESKFFKSIERNKMNEKKKREIISLFFTRDTD